MKKVKPKFCMPDTDHCQKDLHIGTLGEIYLTVDFDDVDHDEIEKLLPLVVKALNAIPAADIAAALKDD